MPRDPRTYITVHDGMPEHPKVERLDDEAFRTLVTMWCWCSRNLTDGFVPQASWDRRVSVASAKQLLDACLAHVVDGGVQMHDYTEHQRTAQEVADLRNKRVNAGRLGGLAKAGRNVASAKASASPVAKQSAKQTASKSLAESETETDIEDSSSEIADANPDPDENPTQQVRDLCTLLADWIVKNGNKKPTVGKRWFRSCRLLIEVDGRTPEQIQRAIDWSQRDQFWSTNILSMPKLREKYDTLRGQASKDKPVSYDPDAWLRSA